MNRAILAAALVAIALPAGAGAAPGSRPGMDPVIGAHFDPGLRLADRTGASHPLGGLIDPAGTLLVLGYHRCENLCGVLQSRLAETLGELAPGRSPTVLFASLDPDEGPEDARAMRAVLGEAVPAADLSRWRFLTGTAPALRAMSAPLGMEIYVRPGGEVIVHPAATAVLTPGGALSDVFDGFDLAAAELDLALARAAEGRVADRKPGLGDRIVALCSGIDEAVGSLARHAWTAIRVAAALTVVLVATALFLLWRREAR